MSTCIVVPLKIINIYVPEIFQFREDEQELVNATCTCGETLKEMCLVQFKETNQQQNMTREGEFGGKLLCEDSHACKPPCWPSYFHGCVQFCKSNTCMF